MSINQKLDQILSLLSDIIVDPEEEFDSEQADEEMEMSAPETDPVIDFPKIGWEDDVESDVE